VRFAPAESIPIFKPTSIQAYQPNPSILDYAATKGAIVTFTKGLAQSLISRGIRANSAAPAPVWTPLVVQSFDEKRVSSFGEDNPMQRPAQPAELAPAFVFLASNESRYVNGRGAWRDGRQAARLSPTTGAPFSAPGYSLRSQR
jgi:NAD(P)-dependent dehydrogenase (short-subunit alcohol dehydrogenase family)